MEIQKIQADLFAKNYDSFNNQIKGPLTELLPQWVAKEYPSLSDDQQDLHQGVFRRLRNDIKKKSNPFTSFDLFKAAKKYLRIECESNLPTAINIKNNLGLTRTKFKQMVAKLKEGDEAIIEKVYLAHYEKCVAIVVKHSSCTQDLAYEVTMDALIEIRTDLKLGRISYGNLESYFTSRAVNKLYKKERKKKIVEQALPDGMEFFDVRADKDELIQQEFNGMVKQAIENLGNECQYILRQFYFLDIKFADIGIEMDKSHQAIRKQASRCRDKLKSFISKKFYDQYLDHFS